jgi:hypothetical protein
MHLSSSLRAQRGNPESHDEQSGLLRFARNDGGTQSF